MNVAKYPQLLPTQNNVSICTCSTSFISLVTVLPETVLTPTCEHMSEIAAGTAGCSMAIPSPNSHAPYCCKTSQAIFPQSASCSYALKKIGKSTIRKRQLLFALNAEDITMVNIASCNTEKYLDLCFLENPNEQQTMFCL